jgi:hypothetical protein
VSILNGCLTKQESIFIKIIEKKRANVVISSLFLIKIIVVNVREKRRKTKKIRENRINSI